MSNTERHVIVVAEKHGHFLEWRKKTGNTAARYAGRRQDLLGLGADTVHIVEVNYAGHDLRDEIDRLRTYGATWERVCT